MTEPRFDVAAVAAQPNSHLLSTSGRTLRKASGPAACFAVPLDRTIPSGRHEVTFRVLDDPFYGSGVGLVRVGVHVFRVSPVHVGEYAVRVVEPQGVTFGFTARMLVVADTGQLTVDLRSVELPKGTPMAREPAALSLLFFLTEHLVKQLFPADANEAYPPIMWRGRVAAGDAPWRGTRAEQVEALFARLTTFQRLHFDTDYSSSESKWSWTDMRS